MKLKLDSGNQLTTPLGRLPAKKHCTLASDPVNTQQAINDKRH